jgi:hypothetical protein
LIILSFARDTLPPSLDDHEGTDAEYSEAAAPREAGQVGFVNDSEHSGGPPADNNAPEPDDLITVPHFWLFKVDADTVITLYPERWDKTNEARLHDHVLNSVSKNRDLQGDSDAFSTDSLVETILKSCLSFEAKAYAKCINPDVPDDSHDVEVSFSKAYLNSIAEIVSD